MFDVYDGEVVTLIGANGAEADDAAINGLNHPRKGRIRFQGRDITQESPHDVVKMGISQSPEGRRLFPRMSVMENLEMGAFQRDDKSGIKESLDRVFELFPRPASAEPAGRDDVGRRAADVRDRAGADGAAEAAVAGRALDGPRTDLRRADLRDRRGDQQAGRRRSSSWSRTR